MTDSELLASVAPNVIDRRSRLHVADAALAAHSIEQRNARRCAICGTPCGRLRRWCSTACHEADEGRPA